MSTRNRQARIAAKMMSDTSAASLSVATSRLMALSNPSDFLSHAQQREVTRMVSEKMSAGLNGWLSASAELAALPYRLMNATARPTAFTPAGCMEAWMALGGLWIGVGNAALRPARKTVVANQARLRRAGGRRAADR